MRPIDILETCIYVDDLGAAEKFYKNVLGLEMHMREEGRHAFFRCGKRMLLVFNPDRTADADSTVPRHGAHGPGHLAFAVRSEEIEAWMETLQQHGVEVEHDCTWPNGGRTVYFRDPAGNSLEFATPKLWELDESKLFDDA